MHATDNDVQAHNSIHLSKRRALTRTIEERPQGPICIALYSAHKHLYQYSASAAVADIAALR